MRCWVLVLQGGRNLTAGWWMALTEMYHMLKIMSPDVRPWHLRLTPLDLILYVSLMVFEVPGSLY